VNHTDIYVLKLNVTTALDTVTFECSTSNIKNIIPTHLSWLKTASK